MRERHRDALRWDLGFGGTEGPRVAPGEEFRMGLVRFRALQQCEARVNLSENCIYLLFLFASTDRELSVDKSKLPGEYEEDTIWCSQLWFWSSFPYLPACSMSWNPETVKSSPSLGSACLIKVDALPSRVSGKPSRLPEDFRFERGDGSFQSSAFTSTSLLSGPNYRSYSV